MKPNIAFDIDGIIANFADPFCVWADQKYGFTFTEHNEFNWKSDQNIPDKAFMEIIAEFIRNHSEMIKPKWDGAEIVRYVWKKTCKPITFITARDYSTVGATHGWMRYNFPDVDSIIITVRSGSDKWRYLDEFDCFVEDRRRTVIDLADAGKIVFMPTRRYNTLQEKKDLLASRGISVANMETTDIQENTIVLIRDCGDITTGVFDDLIFKP